MVHLVSIMGNKGTFGKDLNHILMDTELLYHMLYFFCCIMCVLRIFDPFFYSILVSLWKHISEGWLLKSLFLQLFDVVYREETLLNVINSVTRNGWSIILTAALALILVYIFSIVGFLLFQEDFTMTVGKNEIGKIFFNLHFMIQFDFVFISSEYSFCHRRFFMFG